MMERFDISISDVKSLGFTTLFCIVIALTTMTLWEGDFSEHLVISLGYGYSAFLSAQCIQRRWPELSKRLVNVLSLSCSVVLGTLGAYFWLHEYPGFDDFSAYKPIMVLGFIFLPCAFYTSTLMSRSYWHSVHWKPQDGVNLSRKRPYF